VSTGIGFPKCCQLKDAPKSSEFQAVLGVFLWLGRFNVFSTMNYLGISNLTGKLIQMHGFRYRIPIDGSMDIIHSISLYDNNI
jgi:hypothetical protein